MANLRIGCLNHVTTLLKASVHLLNCGHGDIHTHDTLATAFINISQIHQRSQHNLVFCLLERGSLYIALGVLKLTVEMSLAFNS